MGRRWMGGPRGLDMGVRPRERGRGGLVEFIKAPGPTCAVTLLYLPPKNLLGAVFIASVGELLPSQSFMLSLTASFYISSFLL